MKKLLGSPVFVMSCVLFIIHQVVQGIADIKMPFINSYLDNLLAMPIILTLLLMERKYLYKWKDYNRLTMLETITATLFISLVSEVIFPLFSDKYSGDWIDLIFYMLGAFIFYLTVNNTFEKGS